MATDGVAQRRRQDDTMALVTRKALLVVITLSVGMGVVLYYFLAMPTLVPHKGDGVFVNTSWRFPWVTVGIPLPGYQIKFPNFDLDRDYSASYQIENLPIVEGQHAICYLCVQGTNLKYFDKRISQLVATFKMEVYDEHDQLVCQVDHPLRDLRWSTPLRESGYALYSERGSRFIPLANSHYTLKVWYVGDPQLNPGSGFVYIGCGGSA